MALVALVAFGVWLVAQQVAPSAKQVITVDGVPEALLNANGLVYEGSSTGRLIALDPVHDTVLYKRELGAPIKALASLGSAVFAVVDNTLIRLSSDLAVEKRRHLPTGLTMLAGGGVGLWGIGSSGRQVMSISPATLRVLQSVSIDDPSGGLAVSRSGVWVTETRHSRLVLIARRSHGSFAVRMRISTPREPTALATGNADIWVLATGADELLAYNQQTGVRVGVTSSVDPNASLLAIGSGNAWVGSKIGSSDSITQIGLGSFHQIGDRITVEPSPSAMVVDLQAVWVTSTADNDLTRLDLTGLAADRRRTRHWNTPLGLDPAVYLASSFWLIIFFVWWLLSWRGSDPHAGLPEYSLGPALRVLACDEVQWRPFSVGRTTKQAVKGNIAARLGVAKQVLTAGIDRAYEDEFEEFPPEKDIQRGVERLLAISGFVCRNLSFAPGARHRLRVRVHGPRVSAVQRRYEAIGGGRLCLVTGQWHVLEVDCEHGRASFELRHLQDRIGGEWVDVPVAKEAWISMTCDSGSLTDLGCREVIAGTDIHMDVLGFSNQPNGDDSMTLRHVVSYQRPRV
jgi:hypothetical protein